MLSEPLAAGRAARGVPGSEGSQAPPPKLLPTCWTQPVSQPHTVTIGTGVNHLVGDNGEKENEDRQPEGGTEKQSDHRDGSKGEGMVGRDNAGLRALEGGQGTRRSLKTGLEIKGCVSD